MTPAFKHWVLAARPRTLPAAVTPVVVGSAVAYAEAAFAWLPALLCLVFALLIQIAANFANDYFDAKSGADNAERVGPTRAVAAGLISPRAMWRGTVATLAAAFLVGCGLIPFGGWWLIAVGILSILCALAYTGGPYPLGYHGWGDVFVILFFGLVAVVFTHYVQAGQVSAAAGWLGLGCGLVIDNLLVVNNVRDEATDRAAGKRTVVVRFGRGFGLWLYRMNFAGAWLCVYVAVRSLLGWDFWQPVLAVIALPGLVYLILGSVNERRLRKAETPEAYGRVLKFAAMDVIRYGALVTVLIIGIIWKLRGGTA